MRRTVLLLALPILISCGRADAPAPFGAVPSPQQLEWQKMETNMFMHFGPNTFTSLEWGNGDEDESVFNPTDLDCDQWAETASKAGFGGIIITAKHHDGFCLWPNPMSSHTVAQSSWRDGKGDVLKELSGACADAGVKFGIYISPWDRNDPHYGTPEYNDVFNETLIDAHSRYGDIFEQWFDGACGEGPNGKRQVYDFDRFNATVLEKHPDAVIFSDIGPGCRWVGNERGEAGRTSWSTLDIEGFSLGKDAPSSSVLNSGNVNGACWIPSETDVSIRPGWFWKESENQQVKSLDQLLRIWYESVGRNSLLLLNVPPDTRGHIHEMDSLRLMEFRAALDKIQSHTMAEGAEAKASNVRGRSRRYSASKLLDGDYDSFWAVDDGMTEASVEFMLPEERSFNRVMLQEYIPLGQRVSSFTVEVWEDGGWRTVAEETTIGYKRILLIPQVRTDRLRLNITSSLASPVLNNFALYQDDVYSAGI